MHTNGSRSDILNFLKRSESSVDDLSSRLRISATATRQHLSILERDGLVKRRAVKAKIGRPRDSYSLTEKAETLFPKAYNDLCKWVIGDMIEREGPESVKAMMGRLGTKHAAQYEERVKGTGDVESVVEILNELGAFAEVGSDEGQYLKVCNCPFYEIAQEFKDIICEFHLKFIGSLLNLPVKLLSCMAQGDEDCFYVSVNYQQKSTDVDMDCDRNCSVVTALKEVLSSNLL
jgi:DeoR family suf operon transcriptional repressor